MILCILHKSTRNCTIVSNLYNFRGKGGKLLTFFASSDGNLDKTDWYPDGFMAVPEFEAAAADEVQFLYIFGQF